MRTLVLDFDGVVLESVSIKDQAFHDLFPGLSDAQRADIITYHQDRPGVPRGDKIKGMMTEVLSLPFDPTVQQTYIDRFAQLVLTKVLAVDMVPGVADAIQLAPDNCWLVTAAPTDETELICNKRGIRRWFQGIYGSPTRKPENLRTLLEDHTIAAPDALYIGDKLSDLKAAASVNMPFLGRLVPGEPNPFPSDIETITDFKQGFEVVKKRLSA